MSIQFDQPMNEETAEMIKKFYGEGIKAMDEKNALLYQIGPFRQKDLSAIAKKAKQPATVNVHSVGDIVKMSDGTEYQVTKKGWIKI